MNNASKYLLFKNVKITKYISLLAKDVHKTTKEIITIMIEKIIKI